MVTQSQYDKQYFAFNSMEEEEDTYELAVMRAELLGLPAPDREAFEAAKGAKIPSSEEQQQSERDAVETATLQEAVTQNEELRGITGGLEELSSILSITQTKLNRFKTVCGSIKNLFKLRDGDQSGCNSDSESEHTSGERLCSNKNDNDNESSQIKKQQTTHQSAASGDINNVLTSQVDKLDSLVMKAENAHLNMQSQNKTMKSFLR